MYLRRHAAVVIAANVFLQVGGNPSGDGITGIDGRYSFSLTTFDPTGSLRQVEYATRAASLGPTVVASYLPGCQTAVLVCLKSRPSPLVADDGTSRVVQISSDIVLAHSGIGADGRVAVAAAQRAAIEHEYTFDEPIPIESFLEDMSALMQKYTMKPGARPFGCSLLVAYLPSDGPRCRFYRIDPSGSIESHGVGPIVIGSTPEDILEVLDEEKGETDISVALSHTAKIIDRYDRKPASLVLSDSKDRCADQDADVYLGVSFSRRSGLRLYSLPSLGGLSVD